MPPPPIILRKGGGKKASGYARLSSNTDNLQQKNYIMHVLK